MQAEKGNGTTYVALMFFTMKDSWFEMPADQRAGMTKEHVGTLSRYSEQVKITHLAGTGLSKFDLIELLESDDLSAINTMIAEFKAGAKARHGELRDVFVMEKGIGKLA